MRRKRKGPYHATGGAARHPNSLANLRNAPPAPVGNTRRLTHGGRSSVLVRDVSAEIRELMDALAEAAPVRDPGGGVPAADVTAIEVAARALKRFRHVAAWCDLHGRLSEDGDVKPAADFELRAGRDLAAALDVLGMSPTSRARLGVDLVRARDLALEMAQLDEQEGG